MEVEAKFRLEAVGQLKRRLVEIGFKACGAIRQSDVYYQHPCRDFSSRDEALRVRTGGRGAELTYKGPRTYRGELKEREEITVVVDSPEKADLMLRRLGFIPVGKVVKEREMYSMGGITVSIDRVEELGTFVEIEVVQKEGDPHRTLRDLLEKIGLRLTPVKETYLEMLMDRRHERGRNKSARHRIY